MDEYGKMNDKADKYKGMDRFDCRNQLVKDLKRTRSCYKKN